MDNLGPTFEARPLEGLGVLAVCLLLGVGLDLLLRPLQRRAGHRRWRFLGVLLHALRGAPTVSGVAVGPAVMIAQSGLPREYVLMGIRGALMVLFIMATVVAVRLIASLARMALNQHQPSVSLVNALIRIAGVLLVLAVALGLAGIPLAPLLTLLAGSGLGLSLALRDPLSNLFAGLQIVAAGRVRPGAYVRLATGEEGYVQDVRWSDTTLRQLGNATVVVPNTLLTTSLLLDYSPPDNELSLIVPLSVHYGSDLRRVEQVTLAVAEAVVQELDGAVKGFRPVVRFGEFGEYAIRLSLIVRVRSYVDQYAVRHQLILRLHERYAQEGIVIPFPTLTLAGGQPPAASAPGAETVALTPPD